MTKMKLYRSTCDANINNDIHDEDEDGVGGGISCCVYSSTQLIVIVCLSRQKTGPQREHTLPYDEEDDDEDDLQEFVETP